MFKKIYFLWTRFPTKCSEFDVHTVQWKWICRLGHTLWGILSQSDSHCCSFLLFSPSNSSPSFQSYEFQAAHPFLSPHPTLLSPMPNGVKKVSKWNNPTPFYVQINNRFHNTQPHWYRNTTYRGPPNQTRTKDTWMDHILHILNYFQPVPERNNSCSLPMPKRKPNIQLKS